jgi:membrane dipeptidase
METGMTTVDEVVSQDLSEASESTKRLHDKIFVFDGLSMYYILDEPYTERVLLGGVNATNVTILWEQGWGESLRLMEAGLRKIDANPLLMLARNGDEIRLANQRGKLAVVLGTQGSIMLETDLYRLGILCRLGIRFFGLTYTGTTLYADGCGERRDAGLSFLGEELIYCVNELPLILDLSHCGHRTRAEAVKLARVPNNTHSNAFHLTPNPRNTEDSTLMQIAGKGGVNGVVFHPKFVKEGQPTVHDVLNHIDYMVRLLGTEHVGFGSDYLDGIIDARIQPNPRWHKLRPDVFAGTENYFNLVYPRGLERITKLPNLTQGLLNRGYDEAIVAAIMGGNWLRVIASIAG